MYKSNLLILVIACDVVSLR